MLRHLSPCAPFIGLPKKLFEGEFCVAKMQKESRRERPQNICLWKVQKMTGKPSIEKRYMKNYPIGAADTILPKMKLDEYFFEINKKDQDRIGLIFASTGKKIAVGKMIEEYNNVAKSLISMGLKAGENIAVCLVNAPEVVYTILACSKLGLSINMINPLDKPEKVIERILMLDPKLLIAHDKTARLFNKIKSSINLPIVTTPIVAGITNFGMKPMDKNTGWWKNFIKNGRYETKTNEVPYDEDAPFIYTHTSGSTGPSKTLALRHDTFTHTAHMHAVCNLDYEPGDKWLSTISALFSTGANSSVMLPILLKLTTILEPNYDREKFLKNILKFKPHGSIATKWFWKGMFDNPKYKGVDLSFLRYPVVVGEKVRRHEARKFDGFLRNHNNKYGMANAYGQCELGGGIGNSLLNHRTFGNNTIGFPYTHNEIVIKDLESGKEVDYDQRGEVTVKTTTGMKYYFGMPEKTAEYYKDGVANLGDLGYVNKSGEYFIDGRITDYIQISDNTKLYPYEIEDIMEELLESDSLFEEIIKDYGIYGESYGDFEIPVIQFYVDEKQANRASDIIEQINKTLVSKLSKKIDAIAYGVRTTELPAAASFKVDASLLKGNTDGLVIVDEKLTAKPFSEYFSS